MATSGLWSFVLCDGAGVTLTNLTRNQGTSLTFVRNGVPECTLSLSHDDDECAVILTALANGTGGGVPTLKGYRTGPDGVPVLRFNGYLAGVSEESGVDASTATFTFRGPLGRYVGDGAGRGGYMNAVPIGAFDNRDAGLMARSLLGAAQINAIDVTSGTIEATKVRTRSDFSSFVANTGDAVISLSNVLDGYDFEITPVDSGTVMGILNVYARQGTDKPGAKFEYGPGTLANCSAMHRQTLPPITRVRAQGANGLASVKLDATGDAKYGRWATVLTFSDVVEQGTLDDKAYANLRPNPVKVLDFSPDPALAPAPWDDYWLGDTVQFYANRNALVEGPVSVRVNQITVAIDPDTGLEAPEIPNPVQADEERIIRAGLQAEVV